MQEYLTIKEAAESVGLPPKTIRYYEQIGLIPALQRGRPGLAGNGHRLFTQADINRLQFVKRTRRLGLSLVQVKELLTATERGSASPRLLAFIEKKLSEIHESIQDLQALRRVLEELRQRVDRAEEGTQPCCVPVCGPITCGPESQNPPLVQVGKSGHSERR